ncbi:hypothetical protein F2Q69_00023664 [Brassica cretica]|uniref:Reverse transcriptase domain-containing protein n=1 Tax=Brassica cretica TaxID=69181 RepID=A0A8S9QD57_BRACR|nr:hypothetical protein F2Q69_00023664 [Brassica cretica]
MKKGARIGAFPRGTVMQSSLTVDPTRSSQAIVPDIYGSFHIFQRFASILDPNESLGVKVEPQREHYHDSGLLYLSDLCYRLCMTSRHTRSNAQGPLFTLSNEELPRLERQNHQQLRPTNTTMGDNGGQDDLTSAMTLMQQQMQQMQQTINTQEAARQAAAELAAQQAEKQGAPIGERNLPWNFSTTRSAINPPHCTRQDYGIKPALIGLVQKKIFNGLVAEILLDHIENFERDCNFSRANGVPPDYIKCTFFSFSLDGKAARWLVSLPTGTLTTGESSSLASLSSNRYPHHRGFHNRKLSLLWAHFVFLKRLYRLR